MTRGKIKGCLYLYDKLLGYFTELASSSFRFLLQQSFSPAFIASAIFNMKDILYLKI